MFTFEFIMIACSNLSGFLVYFVVNFEKWNRFEFLLYKFFLYEN